MALRNSFKRLPLGIASTPARSLSTATARPLVFGASQQRLSAAPRYFSTTQRVALEASAVVGDGGNTEPPEHGINVDKSMRMDSSVFFLPSLPSASRRMGRKAVLRGSCGQLDRMRTAGKPS